MACAGDIATQEALAATAILREHFPDLKIRFVNVVDLFRLQPDTEHPHGLRDRDFDSLFTRDKPIIFNFHAYASLIHKFTYRRTNHDNIHVRGYKEKGNINTPLELAIENQIDRFNLAIDVIDRVPRLQPAGATSKNGSRSRSSTASTTPTPTASTNPKFATGNGRCDERLTISGVAHSSLLLA